MVPVVAHRLFGTRYSTFPAEENNLHGAMPILSAAIRSPTSKKYMLPTIDHEHGTRRPVEEIMDMFHPESRLAYTSRSNVNQIWRNSGIRFLLTGIVDEMIDSLSADLIPAEQRGTPQLQRMNYPNAINIYFCRDLEGARGRTRYDVHPDRPAQKGLAIVSDGWHLDEERFTREESWISDMIIIAHELGHALTLPHMPQAKNLMYGNGSTFDAVELTPVQALIAKQHGKRYAAPWFRHIVDEDNFRVAEIPYARHYLGERIPEF
ncbi:hypothetical protein AQUSIP_17110 [Aquicella siphonis]|uniref:Uncharacterized protein n=1 Tax=Aquicella siphonis TaxID=254247 RepID=A0A5E4PHB2_9COXI|nr:hypothetical protein AQUSIP_17110 [Aquicella siphonis]